MIRQIGPEDLDVFKQIRLEALRNEPAAFASSSEDWECLSDEEWERRLTVNPVFVAFDDGQPVGIAGLMRQSPSKMAHRASVIMVYVRKNLRGSGIATSLMMALADHAQSEGIRQLELTVSCENPSALGFYTRAGYDEIGRIPCGIIHDGGEIDEIIMARRIDH